MSFVLDERLKNDTFLLDESEQCLLLMMNDQQYPWFIVVPKKEDASEWHDLPQNQQNSIHQFCIELGKTIKEALNADKINIAALGNVVSQLHIHVIARHKEDAAWPGPVWGKHPAKPYTKEIQQDLTSKIKWPKLPD